MALTLPTFTAGQKIRASTLQQLSDALNILQPVYAIKGADESVNNLGSGTTLQNDDALSLALVANTNYWLDLELIYGEAAGTGIDLKTAWTFPAGCRLDLAVVAPHNAWVAAAGGALEVEWGAWQAVTASPSSTITFGTTNAAKFSAHVRGVVANGANAGSLQLQWAQGVGSASNVTVYRGSCLKLQRLP